MENDLIPSIEEPSVLPESQPEAPRKKLHLPLCLKSRENAARAAFVLGPWVSYLMVEFLNNNDPFDSLTAEQVTLNLVWYYLIFWVIRMLCGRKGLGAMIASGLCFGFSLANHYVLTFRGRIIFPCDLLTLQTAANVAKDYDYTPDKAIWTALALLGAYWLVILLAHLIFHPKGRQKLKRLTISVSSALIVAYCGVFFFTPLLPTIGIYAQQWKTQANGFLLNFMAALRYSFVSKPDGYSSEAAQEIADNVETTSGQTTAATQPTNLIVIMNESFADLGADFPSLGLSADPLAYYHSMTENTVKGMMVSPVTGGGTANVEFEYLTGDSLAFLPSSTVAYQLYCYNAMPSMVSQAASLGYHTTAFHPYLASGWNRTSVYDWIGFDDKHFEDDVQNPQLIRQYVSDTSDYEQIYRWTEASAGPDFVFNVTMQNHSGYAQGWNNLDRSVEVNGSGDGVAAQYFSLMKESDDAIRELVEHYAASDEKTMIVFFGDHQPPLSNSFYERLYGKALDDRTTQEVLQQYKVPFFIWANYDIPERDNVLISSNYLGTLTCQLAGWPLTGYQQLHAALMDVLPVATTIGFVTDDGQITGQESDLPEQTRKLYEQYRLMAYNHLFDEKNHPDGFYG
ncbi:MAG: sulfatase-like hydrolase/transferase [Oscillibacter sp.]|nr:sulfatase-like hydrolase/transferase [Oscillibacter sp.]